MQTCYKSQEHLDELVVAHASCDYFQDFLLRNMDYLLLVAKHVSQLGKTGVGISLNSIVFYFQFGPNSLYPNTMQTHSELRAGE
jgi:hypothetical protein